MSELEKFTGLLEEANKFREEIVNSGKSLTDKISDAIAKFNEMIHSDKFGHTLGGEFCYTWLDLTKDAIMQELPADCRHAFDFSFLYPETISSSTVEKILLRNDK